MDDEGLSLTPEENALLRRSRDPASTRRRLRGVVISGALLAVALLVTSPLVQSWEFLLFFAVAYIAVSTWERIRCARTILAYKDLVRKITERGLPL
jgi:hypothetical protein